MPRGNQEYPRLSHLPVEGSESSRPVWSMDVLGLLRISWEVKKYLLTLKDVFCKWFEAVPLSTMTIAKVLQALQHLFPRFGLPLQVHTNNATYFRSITNQEAFNRSGIKLTFTPTYNPQSNSVERVHRDMGALCYVPCANNIPLIGKKSFQPPSWLSDAPSMRAPESLLCRASTVKSPSLR